MPYELTAKTGRHVWVSSKNPGEPEYGRFLLPDGRNVNELIAAGDIADLGFTPTFVRTRGQKWGDILWTGGMAHKVVSQRFVDALAGMTGWKTFPIILRIRSGSIDGYLGFAVEDNDPTKDVFNQYPHHTFTFCVSDRAMSALRAAGATDYHARHFTDVAELHRHDALH